MQIIMLRKQRIFIMIAISILLYMFLRTKKYSYKIETKLENVNSEIVWEFIADFSNTKKHLIPHITNFSILSESGNYDHWKYSISYEEPMPIWPYLETTAVGHYSIRNQNDVYLISSVHHTCFFNGWMCSDSICEFKMHQISKRDTLYQEEIIYDCPQIISNWCFAVADYTRKDFINNLVNYFKYKRV